MVGNILIIITVLGVAMAQVYFEDRHKYRYIEQYKNIPTYFEVGGANALPTFNKYVTNIQKLAAKNNVTVTYRVQVITDNRIKIKKEKKKSKKFNVPLKKKNVKMSSFEIELRRYASDSHVRKIPEVPKVTTEMNMIVQATKQIGTGKYKPIINRIKTKYTKLVKPVRNNEIILNQIIKK